MSVKGTSKADQITLAKISVDRMQQFPKIEALAALTHSKTGQTHGYLDGDNVQWSERTKKAFEALYQCIEEDMARTHFNDVHASSGESTKEGTGLQVAPGGLAEHLGTADDTPSI